MVTLCELLANEGALAVVADIDLAAAEKATCAIGERGGQAESVAVDASAKSAKTFEEELFVDLIPFLMKGCGQKLIAHIP